MVIYRKYINRFVLFLKVCFPPFLKLCVCSFFIWLKILLRRKCSHWKLLPKNKTVLGRKNWIKRNMPRGLKLWQYLLLCMNNQVSLSHRDKRIHSKTENPQPKKREFCYSCCNKMKIFEAYWPVSHWSASLLPASTEWVLISIYDHRLIIFFSPFHRKLCSVICPT